MKTTLASSFRFVILVGAVLLAGLGAAPSTYAQYAASRSDASEEHSSGSMPDVTDVLEGWGKYSVLISALERKGIVQGRQMYSSYTLLAPTDSAFAALNVPISEMPRSEAADVLRNHVLQNALIASELRLFYEIDNARGLSVRVAPTTERIGGRHAG